MQFIPMKELLDDALAQGYAVPSFCVWNAETILTVLRTATELSAPVILMNGPGEFPLLGPKDFGPLAHEMAKPFKVTAALHLDHGDSLQQVKDCLESGYTSVMLDYSAYPYEENVAGLQEVVAMAHPLGVTVEGEIGHVGKVDTTTTEGKITSTLTEPSEAVSYVEETRVDVLAVSLGNAHGKYTRLPCLDFDRLAQIRETVSVPLVLHGGSGTPDEDLRRAISLDIAKVNVATELVSSVRETLTAQWQAGQNLWTPLAQAEAMQAMKAVVEKWIRRTGAMGKA